MNDSFLVKYFKIVHKMITSHSFKDFSFIAQLINFGLDKMAKN